MNKTPIFWKRRLWLESQYGEHKPSIYHPLMLQDGWYMGKNADVPEEEAEYCWYLDNKPKTEEEFRIALEKKVATRYRG